jgi:RPA family protein
LGGADLNQVKVVGNVLKVEEQRTFTKFDVEDCTGLVEVRLWFGNGSGVFMAERRAACRYAHYLDMFGLYSPIGKRQNTKRRAFRESLHLCVFLNSFSFGC